MQRALPDLPVAFAEADLQRLCGPTNYSRADALQRAGHVLGPSLVNRHTLRARVRGTWRRLDDVTVTAASARLAARCSCGGASLCRHAGALLLHWLRAQASFEVPPRVYRSPFDDEDESESPEALEPLSPVEELADLLDRDVAPRLREIARRRGVTLAARTKEEVVQQLAAALADPGNVDAALAALDPAERLALDVAQLATAEHGATEAAIGAAYRAVAEKRAPVPVTALYERGLLALEQRASEPAGHQYRVPLAVLRRLPAETALAPSPVAPSVVRARDEPAGGLGLGEAIVLLARELGQREVPLHLAPNVYPFGLPRPWEVQEVPSTRRSAPPASGREYYGYTEIRLTLGGAPLRSDERAALARKVGLPGAGLLFVLDLLALLGIVEGSGVLRVQADRLQALLDLPPAARLERLLTAWLGLPEWNDAGRVVGANGGLELRARTYYYGQGLPLPPLARLRAALAALVGRLPLGRWYDPASLVERLYPFHTALGFQAPPTERQIGGWLVRADRPRERLDPTALDGWKAGMAPFVTAYLGGPLAWLGLVDVVTRDQRLVAFRPRAGAALLARRPVPDDALAAAVPLRVDADLGVRVPAGADLAVHGLLDRAGEVVEATARGLRYRLTAAGVHDVFDDGLSGPELIGWLERQSGEALPAAARATLEGWWASYGTLRLYDELTLLELGDDVLLRELLATTSLKESLLHTFSPRLVAVDPTAADALIAELTRLGHTPRLVEGG